MYKSGEFWEARQNVEYLYCICIEILVIWMFFSAVQEPG